MTHLKDHLAKLHAALVEVEGHARELKNHNFADIMKSAHGKVHQLMTHPDLEIVHEHVTAGDHGEAKTKPFPGGGRVVDGTEAERAKVAAEALVTNL
jgi:hypothetical protein